VIIAREVQMSIEVSGEVGSARVSNFGEERDMEHENEVYLGMTQRELLAWVEPYEDEQVEPEGEIGMAEEPEVYQGMTQRELLASMAPYDDEEVDMEGGRRPNESEIEDKHNDAERACYQSSDLEGHGGSVGPYYEDLVVKRTWVPCGDEDFYVDVKVDDLAQDDVSACERRLVTQEASPSTSQSVSKCARCRSLVPRGESLCKRCQAAMAMQRANAARWRAQAMEARALWCAASQLK
jgi:hypothetical protein